MRWQHQGRTRRGLDCVGLVIMVARDLGLSTFDTTAYNRLPDGQRMREMLREHCFELGGLDLSTGLVALLKFETDPQHVAIVADHPGGGHTLIHALAQNRKVVEHRLDHVWRGRLIALYKLPRVAYGF